MTTTPAPTDIDTAVDVAARAIQAYQARNAFPPEQYTWDAIPQEWRDRHLAAARVMVEATQKPLLDELAKTRAELDEAKREVWALNNSDDGRVVLLESLIARMRPVLEYVSRGRSFVDVDGPYPDATARRVLAQVADATPAATPKPQCDIPPPCGSVNPDMPFATCTYPPKHGPIRINVVKFGAADMEHGDGRVWWNGNTATIWADALEANPATTAEPADVPKANGCTCGSTGDRHKVSCEMPVGDDCPEGAGCEQHPFGHRRVKP